MNHDNGNHHNVAVVDVIEDEHSPEQAAGTFYDSDNPELKAPKQIDAGNKKGWKRKFVGWLVALLLVFGSAVALYLLLKVNRVNVRVDADSRRDSQSAKPNPNSNNPENSLTSEAINIARAASGTDEATQKNPNPTSSPNGSPSPTPSPTTNLRTNYGFTGNSSPVFDPIVDAGLNGNASQQQNGSGNQQPEK